MRRASSLKKTGAVMREAIMTAQRGHEADFTRVLPTKMAELVREGLFEPHDGTYRITAKGRARLKELERDQ